MIINVKKIKVMLKTTREKLASLKKTCIDLFNNRYELENVSEQMQSVSQMQSGITITNDLKI